MQTPESLYLALDALRAADDPFERRHDAAWRVIEEWLRGTFPGTTPEIQDARQETLITIARSVGGMEARVPLQAAKWVSTIHKRKRVDGLRARVRDPVHLGLERGRRREGDEERPRLVERLEAGDEGALDAGAIERILATIEEHVEAHLATLEKSDARRHLLRQQARATLHRVLLGADVAELAATLDLASDAPGEPVARDRVYKWVERGRPIVLAGLDRWVAEQGDGSVAADVAAVVRELIEARRSDAGRPRPERRKGRGG